MKKQMYQAMNLKYICITNISSQLSICNLSAIKEKKATFYENYFS